MYYLIIRTHFFWQNIVNKINLLQRPSQDQLEERANGGLDQQPSDTIFFMETIEFQIKGDCFNDNGLVSFSDELIVLNIHFDCNF